MRLAILPPLMLLAAAAHAQQIDTRVEEVSESPDGFTCRSHALPELRISHDWRDGARSAVLTLPARDTSAGELLLRFALSPDADAPFGVSAAIRGFVLSLDRSPLRNNARGAHLRIDGMPDATILTVDGDRRSLSVAIIERQRDELAQRLMKASIVELDLEDASGVPLARYSWDVRALRRAPPQLQAINWSCR